MKPTFESFGKNVLIGKSDTDGIKLLYTHNSENNGIVITDYTNQEQVPIDEIKSKVSISLEDIPFLIRILVERLENHIYNLEKPEVRVCQK